jgi:threonine synthase
VMVDTHTADGIKVGMEQRRPNLPLICLETALPAKFEETIVEALGRLPERPASMVGIEKLPQRCVEMDADVVKLKAYISANVPQ